MNDHAIRTEALVKRYGDLVALAGVDLEVERGTIFGLLGPNGAGKTTAVRILSTILKPDGGRAEVLGQGRRPRGGGRSPSHRPRGAERGRRPQPDRTREPPPGGVLGQMPGAEVTPRATDLLERFDLSDGRRPPAANVLGRHAPASRRRRIAHDPPAGAVPRRAHHGPRPDQPQLPVGDDRAARRRGHDGPAHHAVSRRGRPARQTDRGGGRRQGDRERRAEPAQVAARQHGRGDALQSRRRIGEGDRAARRPRERTGRERRRDRADHRGGRRPHPGRRPADAGQRRSRARHA